MSLPLEILIVLLLILLNGFLAMAEMAVVSARKVRLQQRSEAGDPKARAALLLANEPSDFLSTVQVGITLVGVLSGAFGGATIAEELAGWLARIPALASYSEALGVGIVVLVITYLSLVLGELAPKRLALTNPEDTASRLAPGMRSLTRLVRPLVRLLSGSSSLVVRLLGVRPSEEPPVTEEEIKVMIDQGTQAGVLAEAEQDMLEAVLRLGDRRINTLATPRPEIVWLDLQDSLEENLEIVRSTDHNDLPVADGSLDEVLGVVQARDILALRLAGQPVDLRQLAQEALFVPENTPALRVLDLFRQSRQQLALVLDEFGGLQGMVTAYDILEAIVGEFPEQGGLEAGAVVRRADGSFLVDGRLTIAEFKDALDLPALPAEERGYYETVGGFAMTALGRIPRPADRFEWAGWRFEVMDMDGMRVDKILAVPSSLTPPAGE